MPASCALEFGGTLNFSSLHTLDFSSNASADTASSYLKKKDVEERSASPEMMDLVLEGLRKASGKEVPFQLLYDKRGSQLYESITKLESYYPYRTEEEMLSLHADAIASHIPEGSVVVELGCGGATKTARLLTALIARHGRCRFVGVDVSESFLEEARCNLMLLVGGSLTVDLVKAEFLSGLKQARMMFPDDPLCVLWLGSSVGNLTRQTAITFFADVVQSVGKRSRFFLCADMWKDTAVLRDAYHDEHGLTEAFIKNGMRNALNALNCDQLVCGDENSWVYEVDVNEELRQVEMYLKFPAGVSLPKHLIDIRRGERVLMEISRKFSVGDVQQLAEGSGFHIHGAWQHKLYSCQIFLTSTEALLQCWDDTDVLFQGLPQWSVKPIDVRHPFCFYYGHMSSFMKMKLFSNEPFSELDTMFSRGIDPDVLEPSKCHSHPDIPASWPPKEEIVAYVKRNRVKTLQAILDSKERPSRLVNLVLEHERMHQETLLYMVAQERKIAFDKNMSSVATQVHSAGSNTTEPPTSMSILNSLAKSKMVAIQSGHVVLGAEECESGFLWDNEMPKCRRNVETPFWVSSMPVSVGEFLRFVKEEGYKQPHLWEFDDYLHFKEKGWEFPATWSWLHGEYFVHESRATNHWSKVASHPVFVSLSEARAFCKWVGCKVMTEEQYHRVLDVDSDQLSVHQMRSGGWEWTCTPFQPFPGYKEMPEYPEYSTDFFDGNHFVLKGASPATHPSVMRDSFRNFYQKQYRYVFAKFRCCK